MKKLFTVTALLCIQFCFAQTYFDPSLPIVVSDNVGSLQGIRQYNPFPANPFFWYRPGYNNTAINMLVGGMAVNPNNLSQVFFSDNSATNKLYFFNRASTNEVSSEIFTGNYFTGALQGVNSNATLPNIGSENIFGINMMVINGSNNTGYAISKDKNLYTFSTISPYTVINLGSISDVSGNIFSYANTEGGGVMINTDNRLTVLVNIRYFDPMQMVDTFKHCFFDIDPATLKAKYLNQTQIGYYGFQDSRNFITGVGITNVSNNSMFCSVYDKDDNFNSVIYKYIPSLNKFGDGNTNSVYLLTNNNSFGDISGVGKTSIKANVPILDFIWQGTISTNWNTAGNWNKNAVPTSNDQVIIQAGTTFAPTLGISQTVKNLTINANSVLTSSATLTITGACINNGSILGTGNVLMSGNTTQTLSGTGLFKKLGVNTGANVLISTGSNLKFQ